MTNGEKLRASDEALTEFIFYHVDCVDCPAREICSDEELETAMLCTDCMKKWLNQEAEEE